MSQNRFLQLFLSASLIVACGVSEPNLSIDSGVAQPPSPDGWVNPATDGETAPSPQVDAAPPASKGISEAEFCQTYGAVGCCMPDMGVLFCQGEANPEVMVLECPGQCGWNGNENYYDCNESGADPSGANAFECPEIDIAGCEPSCTAGTCDNADGCGGTCGCNAGQTCSAGSCVTSTTPPACTNGQKRCSGDNVEVCSSGNWALSETCDSGCLSGICVTGSCSGCDIAASSVKVSLPYASTNPPTLVSLSGSCYVGMSSDPCGYKTASVLMILADKTNTVAIKDVYGGGYVWGIQLDIDQRDPTSSEYSSLASSTGISTSVLKKSSATKLTTKMSSKPSFDGYSLPAGVDVQLWLPTGGSDAYVRFTSSTKTDLDPVLSQIKGSGITMNATLIPFSGYGTYNYTFKLSSSGVKVTKISK